MVLGVPPRLEHCFSSSLIALNLRNVSWCPLAFSPPTFQTRIQAGLWQMALHLLELMFRCGPRPSAITTSSALKGVESWSVALATTQGLRNHGFYGKVLESTCMSDLENFDVTCDLTIHGRSLKFHSTSGVIGSQWLQSLALWRFGRCQGLRLDGISWLSVTRAMAQRWDMSLHLAWTSAKSEVMVSVPLETQWEWTMQLLKDRDLSEVGLCWWYMHRSYNCVMVSFFWPRKMASWLGTKQNCQVPDPSNSTNQCWRRWSLVVHTWKWEFSIHNGQVCV